jgi:hypothetical protein
VKVVETAGEQVRGLVVDRLIATRALLLAELVDGNPLPPALVGGTWMSAVTAVGAVTLSGTNLQLRLPLVAAERDMFLHISALVKLEMRVLLTAAMVDHDHHRPSVPVMASIGLVLLRGLRWPVVKRSGHSLIECVPFHFTCFGWSGSLVFIFHFLLASGALVFSIFSLLSLLSVTTTVQMASGT